MQLGIKHMICSSWALTPLLLPCLVIAVRAGHMASVLKSPSMQQSSTASDVSDEQNTSALISVRLWQDPMVRILSDTQPANDFVLVKLDQPCSTRLRSSKHDGKADMSTNVLHNK